MASGDLPPMVFLGMQVKKRESLSPDQLPPSSCSFPSSLRAISTVSKFREHGKYRAVSHHPIIKSLRCEKITQHARSLKWKKKQGTQLRS